MKSRADVTSSVSYRPQGDDDALFEHAFRSRLPVMIIYHSTLTLFGVVELAKTMPDQCWRFSLIGRYLPERCPGTGSDG